MSVPIHKTPSPTSTGVECLCDVSKSLKYLPNCIHKLKVSHPQNSQSNKYWSPGSVPIHQTPIPTNTGVQCLFPSTKLPVLHVLEVSVCSHPPNSQSYKYWSQVSVPIHQTPSPTSTGVEYLCDVSKRPEFSTLLETTSMVL